MPFAELPSSPFQAPQAPDWSRFALQANEGIMRGAEIRAQAGESLSNSVLQAAGQINQILKLSSPDAKLARDVERLKLQAQKETYTDYTAHPEKYQLTANGPVMRDPLLSLERAGRYRNMAVNTMLNQEKLKQAQKGNGIDNFLESLRSNAKQHFGSDQLPSNQPQDQPDVAPGQPNPAPPEDLTPTPLPDSGSLFNTPGVNPNPNIDTGVSNG